MNHITGAMFTKVCNQANHSPDATTKRNNVLMHCTIHSMCESGLYEVSRNSG